MYQMSTGRWAVVGIVSWGEYIFFKKRCTLFRLVWLIKTFTFEQVSVAPRKTNRAFILA